MLENLIVLVVDDHEGARNIVARALKRLGFEKIFTASDGLEAVKIFEENQIDFLITDRRMPGMLGEEVIRRFKIKHPEKKALFMSGDDREKFEKVASAAGADAVLHKPINLEDLKGLIGKFFPKN